MTTAFCPACQKVQPMRVERWQQRDRVQHPGQHGKPQFVTIERVTCRGCHRCLKDTRISEEEKWQT